MTAPGWPEIVARLHRTLAACDRDTDLELAAGPRRLRLSVRRDTVEGHCPGGEAGPRLADLGWRSDGTGGWWYATERTAEGLHWWSGFAARTAAVALTADPGALSCRVLPVPQPADPAPVAHPAAPTSVPYPAEPAPVAQPAEPELVALLAQAAARRDLSRYLGVLAAGPVCVPLAGEPSPEREFPWTVVLGADRAPLLPVFTSADALTAFTGAGVPFVALAAADLLADWPDPGWGLAVDPGAAHGLTLTAPALAALLAANDLTGPEPGSPAPSSVAEPDTAAR
ncbi:SseB family protein [Micromonospora sp. URMC 105]|uniref:SseB family protein n=1 Tax=Micromonospora sp. URMC 105 TaxID=3423413 RepID=UPI003F1DFE17